MIIFDDDTPFPTEDLAYFAWCEAQAEEQTLDLFGPQPVENPVEKSDSKSTAHGFGG